LNSRIGFSKPAELGVRHSTVSGNLGMPVRVGTLHLLHAAYLFCFSERSLNCPLIVLSDSYSLV
jgi:hypothetical protein